MNRIKINPLAVSHLPKFDHPSVAIAFEQIEKLSVTSRGECSVFVPMNYEPNYKYPLVVWLHENGDDNSQMQRLMSGISLRNYVGIGPNGTFGDEQAGFYWSQCDQGISSADESVLNAIDQALLRFNINDGRIFLGGCARGGEMAFRIAFQRPELFAGVISLNGSIPEQDVPLADWQRCRDLPVFWAHCRESIELDEDLLCEQLRLLHIAGFSVTLRQYPGEEIVVDSMLPDVNNWVMEMIETAVGTRRNS